MASVLTLSGGAASVVAAALLWAVVREGRIPRSAASAGRLLTLGCIAALPMLVSEDRIGREGRGGEAGRGEAGGGEARLPGPALAERDPSPP